MHSFPRASLRVAAWVITLLLPPAAWIAANFSLPFFRSSAELFFPVAACLSAAALGTRTAAVGIILNLAAFNLFCYFYRPGVSGWRDAFWSLLLVAPAMIVGYAREKWGAAERLAGRLRSDLDRLRDELQLQRADLRRFQELSVRLSSSLDVQQVLHDVLHSIASLQKTDLALLLLLPAKSSNTLRVEAHAGFTPEQIKLFGAFPALFFSLQRRACIEDIQLPGTFFPFMEAARQVGFRALFTTPIINARKEPLGVVLTFFREPHTPTDRQSRLTQLYASQAANALDNARLHRESRETLKAEQERTAVLRFLAEASVKMNSALSLDSLLQIITDQARNIIRARQAFTTLLPKGAWNHCMTCFSGAEGPPAFDFPRASSEMFMLACTLNRPVRLSADTEGEKPWLSVKKTGEAARHGWLAAPLVTRDGRNLGLIQLSDKLDGEFSLDDEVVLVQLANMASVAIDNVRLYREAQEQIAEIKRTHEALERSKESLVLAQQCVGIGIWEWNLETGSLTWSDEIRRLHGFAADTFDGKYESWMQCIHPEDRHQVHQSITEAVLANSEYEIQYRILFPDKSVHWLEARGKTMFMGDRPLRMLGIAMDISARKQSEEALRNSEKLAATGRLAASIAHEINNPLAAVTNALYLLRTSFHLPAAPLDYVKTAEAELSRVVHITKQTLGFYREITAPVMTSIPRLLEEVLAAYDLKIEKRRIRVDKAFRCSGHLHAFPGELRQVLSNLILNALEAVPAAGIVSLRVKEVHEQSRLGIRVTVADNGPGIPPANMARLFQPFFSTKDSKGTGLGLWVSQGIVQKHGGSIRVRSSVAELHHGTCFVIFLPLQVTSQKEMPDMEGTSSDALTIVSASTFSGGDVSAA